MKGEISVKLTPIILSIVTVIIYMDTHTLHPFLSAYAMELGAGVLMAGIIVAVYSFSEDIFEIVFGYLMDKVGRRKVFLFGGMVGDGINMLLYSLARNPLFLLCVRASHGFTGSIAGPSVMSLTADVPHPLAKMGARMGVYGFSIGLACIIGFVMGGVLVARLGYDLLFYLVSGTLLVCAILCLFIREPPPFLEATGNPKRKKISIGDLKKRLFPLLKKKGYSMACLGIFTHMMTMGALTVLLPLYAKELGMDPAVVGMTLGVFGLAWVVCQIPMGVVSDRIGRIRSLLLGLAFVSASMFCLSFMTSLATLMLTAAAYGASYSLLFPTLCAMVIENSELGERALASGFYHVLFTEGVVAGCAVFPAVAAVYGYAMGLRISCLAPLSALLIAVLVFAPFKRGGA